MIEIKDIRVLRFLDNHLEASKVLGVWYIESLNKGLTTEALETYLFDQWLPTVGYNIEQINFLKSKYINFQIPVETPTNEQVIINNTEETIKPKPNMEIFLKENLDLTSEQFKQILDWYNSVDTVVGTTYIFEKWLPSLLPAESVQFLIDKYNNSSSEVKELTENIDINQTEAPLSQPDNSTEVESNLSTIRQLEKEISEKITKVMLLKEPYLINNGYVNNSYDYCPSFKKMLPQIQKAIIKKREQKVNEKWFEKYRPELFEEILFPNTTIKETISEFVEKKHIAGNCMFYGFGGVGKTTTNQVLMNAILENVADRFVLDRKIDSVDELKGWLTKKPIGKQKIVIAEEFDRLSDAAMTELKNGLMEKYEYVVFLASTNKIHKIDEALLTRFTNIFRFETAQVSDLFDKCRYILTNERIQFSEEDLEFFIEQNKLRGIRTILNNLQLSCYMGIFEPKRTAFFIGDSGTEFDVVSWVKWYIGYLIQLPKEQLWQLSYNYMLDQNIAKVRSAIYETVITNYSLNYEYIFTELLKDSMFLPIKNCINNYYQDIDVKRIKSMHFEAMLNDFINILFTTKDIYK